MRIFKFFFYYVGPNNNTTSTLYPNPNPDITEGGGGGEGGGGVKVSDRTGIKTCGRNLFSFCHLKVLNNGNFKWAVTLFFKKQYKLIFLWFLYMPHPKTLYNMWIKYNSFRFKKLFEICWKYEPKFLYGNAIFSHLIISPNLIILVLNFLFAKSNHYHLIHILFTFKVNSSFHSWDTGC